MAVIDTGVDLDHPDLTDCVDRAGARSFISLDATLDDRSGHGTHVAGILAGSGAVSAGRYRGIAPGITLLSIKAFSQDGRGSNDDVAAAMEYAIASGVDIISYSASAYPNCGPPPWQWSTKPDVVGRALGLARASGILCVTAAGNWGPGEGSIGLPGVLDAVLTVGALAFDGTVAEGSSRGPVFLHPGLPSGQAERVDLMQDRPPSRGKPDVVVPGGRVPPWGKYYSPIHELSERASDDPDGVVSTRGSGQTALLPHGSGPYAERYTTAFGTSQAVPVVSGLAALAIEFARDLDLDMGDDVGDTVSKILTHSARRLLTGTAEDWGKGSLHWPLVAATLEDCAGNEQRRRAVFNGPHLHLMP